MKKYLAQWSHNWNPYYDMPVMSFNGINTFHNLIIFSGWFKNLALLFSYGSLEFCWLFFLFVFFTSSAGDSSLCFYNLVAWSLLKFFCICACDKFFNFFWDEIDDDLLELTYLIWRSDISNRARILLSRLSKIFIRNQAMKKPTFSKLPRDVDKEIIRKQRHVDFFLTLRTGVNFLMYLFNYYFFLQDQWNPS